MSHHFLPAGLATILFLASACTQSGGVATPPATMAATAPCRPRADKPIGEPLEVWQRLRECLAAGDAKGALTFIDTASQDFYGKIFFQMGDDLPTLQSSWPKTPQFVRNDGTIAQYLIVVKGDEDAPYLLDFVRRKDGGWYAASF